MDKTLQANTLTHPSHSTSACPTCGSISLRSEAVRDPPSPALLKFLQSNNLPSDVERVELTATASTWTSETSDIEQDIARVQETLKALILKRNGVTQNLNSVKSALHPIRSIPDSILREIFMLCVKGWDDFVAATTVHDSLDSRHPPWTLSQVSHHWRHVALSTPQLWSSISLNFNAHQSYRDLFWSFKFGIHLQRAESLNSLVQLIIDGPSSDCPPCQIDTFRIAPAILDLQISPRVAPYLDFPWKKLVDFRCAGLQSDRSLDVLRKLESAEKLSLHFDGRAGCGRLQEEAVLPRVTFLQLSEGNDYMKTNMTNIADFFLKAKFPSLTTLILAYNHDGKFDFPLVDAASCPGLQTLYIECDLSSHFENPKRLASFLSTIPNISSLTICADGVNKAVISKLVRRKKEDVMPNLRFLDLRSSEFTVSHALIVDMVLSRCKGLDRAGSMHVLLEKLCLDEPLVLTDLRAASRWKEAIPGYGIGGIRRKRPSKRVILTLAVWMRGRFPSSERTYFNDGDVTENTNFKKW
ncbi:hypothetical protein EDD85DRAFT_976530 [Armillaria nabsnona]|nr:hypothetical protein EDD85DRAFT_976530 [Armillaria nabsnona]